ncbi:MAG: hypothetical protein WCP39_05785, partial [Chlamydiota bacterium]
SIRITFGSWSSEYAGQAIADVFFFPENSITSPDETPNFCIVIWSILAIPLDTSLCLESRTFS